MLVFATTTDNLATMIQDPIEYADLAVKFFNGDVVRALAASKKLEGVDLDFKTALINQLKQRR